MTGPRSGKADPDCERCGGRGAYRMKVGAAGMRIAIAARMPIPGTITTRCPCTDLRNDPAPPKVG